MKSDSSLSKTVNHGCCGPDGESLCELCPRQDHSINDFKLECKTAGAFVAVTHMTFMPVGTEYPRGHWKDFDACAGYRAEAVDVVDEETRWFQLRSTKQRVTGFAVAEIALGFRGSAIDLTGATTTYNGDFVRPSTIDCLLIYKACCTAFPVKTTGGYSHDFEDT